MFSLPLQQKIWWFYFGNTHSNNEYKIWEFFRGCSINFWSSPYQVTQNSIEPYYYSQKNAEQYRQ